MNFQRFNIVLVDFPFTDLSITKKRPALVIKPLEGDNTILCQITTKRRAMQKYEVYLPKMGCKGDVRFDSYAYLDMIFTLYKNLIYGKIGEISDSSVKEKIKNKLKDIFI